MADLTRDVAESHQLAPHQTGASIRIKKLRHASLRTIKPQAFDASTIDPRMGAFNDDEARDKSGQWTSGTPTASGPYDGRRMYQHVGVGFAADSPLPSQFAAIAEDRLHELSRFSGLGDVSVHALAVYNAERASEAGKPSTGEYNPVTDKVSVAYNESWQKKKCHVETGAERVTVGTCPLDFFDHEVGHHVWYKMLSDTDRQAWMDVYNPFMFAKSVSAYAAKGQVEGFAEAFSAYVSGARLPGAAQAFMAARVGVKR